MLTRRPGPTVLTRRPGPTVLTRRPGPTVLTRRPAYRPTAPEGPTEEYGC
ncbi:hypothetical protein [Plantactinospora sp. WMMB782]